LRDRPVEYFRAVPARGFAWLGALVFVAGWMVAVDVAVSDLGNGSDVSTSSRISILMSIGIQVTIAAGILWGVAAFLWVKVLPSLPDEAAEP
jgi:hypothetical protein